MKSLMRLILLAVLAVYSLSMCGSVWASKYPLKVRDCRGKMITIRREPKRIVSTAPSNTEILFALGLDSRIVGVGSWDRYPAAAEKKAKVGDRITSLEKVISLKPDLVVAHGTLNDSIIPAIEKYGITVVATDPRTIDQVEKDIILLGKIANREKQAVSLAEKLSSAKAQVRSRVAKSKGRPKVLVAIQSEPLRAAGPGTIVDEMIKLAGGINVASDAKPGYNQYSAEAAVFKHPDIIIGTDKGSKAIFTRGLWKHTAAAESGRVHEVLPDYLVRPGPRLSVGILTIARLIHPELFK